MTAIADQIGVDATTTENDTLLRELVWMYSDSLQNGCAFPTAVAPPRDGADLFHRTTRYTCTE